MDNSSRRAFTLIELLVSIAIIALITGISMAGFSKFTATAQNTRCIEFVHQTKTALEQIYQRDSVWPRLLIDGAGAGDGKLDARIGVSLARNGVMSLTYKAIKRDDGSVAYTLSGRDKFGVVTPWALDYIANHADSATMSSKLPGGGTIDDHILRYSVDLDDDGLTEVAHGHDGVKATVRAQACVWSYGRDGKPNTKDDVRSWTKGQEVIW